MAGKPRLHAQKLLAWAGVPAVSGKTTGPNHSGVALDQIKARLTSSDALKARHVLRQRVTRERHDALLLATAAGIELVMRYLPAPNDRRRLRLRAAIRDYRLDARGRRLVIRKRVEKVEKA